ncbi:hypothetical protein [Kushneria aurantia]|uniref:ParB/Sulfiredoxin domain-containing protein n=1 Tax=Kushneria aurantia TaxID=504092 RepID=A0ABV6G086_9GAMM|nr:hypothetical protein [Kushneria aurantia]
MLHGFQPPAGGPLEGHRRLATATFRVRLRESVKLRVQRTLGQAIEKRWFERWLDHRPGGARLERMGLPRRELERRLEDALTVWVDPRELIRNVDFKGVGNVRPSSSAFIWDGDWDLSRGDLRRGSRYRFISELDEHRNDLRHTHRFAELHARLEAGHPHLVPLEGLRLDSDDKIVDWLQRYVGYMDHMARNGFDSRLGKDELGVAVTRDGRLVKINRGLHRLAMAQHLGLSRIPVRVRAVHRQWWQRITADASGMAAIDRLTQALPHCPPETRPGPLDPTPDRGAFEWPVARLIYHHGVLATPL